MDQSRSAFKALPQLAVRGGGGGEGMGAKWVAEGTQVRSAGEEQWQESGRSG